ncbi:unnamed protein product [Clonostachys rosea]|uniref:Rho-GAP domain-containing protein n=1 Tax=Bionectria ochroleuca TaxID=29856 RepID=A0ABY6U0X3_BIOOC|nr:unnamed protein product [Clonostachys rosea]
MAAPVSGYPTHPIPNSCSTTEIHTPLRRVPRASRSSTSLAFPQSATVHHLGGQRDGPMRRTSRTWTTSSGDLGLMSDTDEFDDRALVVQEYNRLAKKHGVRLLVIDDFKIDTQKKIEPAVPEKRGWLHRMLRSSSNGSHGQRAARSTAMPGTPSLQHRRSVSECANQLAPCRRNPTRTLTLQGMIRLSGKSVLYLPQDYTPGSLVLPTCLRATAQHLSQHVTTRGIFRISGSVRVVNTLFDYYCYSNKGGLDVSSTVRCANLPSHIEFSIHDVASTFKRMISTLPGGILGTLSIFDALVAIHAQLRGDPEFPRTKQTKVRARLIALAIGTIESQFRRELICAVFGLLSLIGRVAEVTPREDEDGRPLPTGDLMGYSALGIVFGPLLVGELLDQYDMNFATPSNGLLLLPPGAKKIRQVRRKPVPTENNSVGAHTINKVNIVNSITEMLIANWRDVVRQMKAIGIHHRKDVSNATLRSGSLRPSFSESYTARKPPRGRELTQRESGVQANRDKSPVLEAPMVNSKIRQPQPRRSFGSGRLKSKPSTGVLSPTMEEGSIEGERRRKVTSETWFREPAFSVQNGKKHAKSEPVNALGHHNQNQTPQQNFHATPRRSRGAESSSTHTKLGTRELRSSIQEIPVHHSPELSTEDVPPRTSSKQGSIGFPSLQQIIPAEDHEVFNSPGDRARHSLALIRMEQLRAQSQTPPSKSRHIDARSEERKKLPSKSIDRVSQVSNRELPSTLQVAEPPVLIPDHQIEALESDLFHDLSQLRGGSIVSPRSEHVNMDHTKKEMRMSKEEHEAQPPNGREILYLSPNGDVEKHISVSYRDEDFISTNPAETGAPNFYAPMRVPGHPPGMSSSSRPLLTKIPGAFAANDAPREGKLSSPNIKPINALASQRLDRFEPKDIVSRGAASRNRKIEDKSQMRSKATLSPRSSASKQAGVRAMAAMFENQDPPSKSSPILARETTEAFGSTHRVQPTKIPQKASNATKFGSKLGSSTPPNPTPAMARPKTPNTTTKKTDGQVIPKLRTSVSDSVALRAAAIMQAEKQHQGPNSERPPFAGLRHIDAASKMEPNTEKGLQSQMNISASLGTMVPPQEQPPVAQYLNLSRPQSAMSTVGSVQTESLSVPIISTPIQRTGSTSLLHSQLRSLQRQLQAKVEESSQLRRQLEAQENFDVGTLSEQLREAKRELLMWKERAEAAERRVKVFEKFTSKLKGIRQAAAAADEKTHQGEQLDDDAFGEREDSSDNEKVADQDHHVRFLEGYHVKDRQGSDDSGRTEDAGVITARIRRCLHGGQESLHTHDGTVDQIYGTVDGASADEAGSLMRTRPANRDMRLEALDIWMAAQELLEMEDALE